MSAGFSIGDLQRILAKPVPGATPPQAIKPFPVQKQEKQSTPPPIAQTKPAKGFSIVDLQKILGAKPQPSLAQRAFEALPGGKATEGFVQGQEEYWGGVGKHLKTEKEMLFGKPGRRGEVQQAWTE